MWKPQFLERLILINLTLHVGGDKKKNIGSPFTKQISMSNSEWEEAKCIQKTLSGRGLAVHIVSSSFLQFATVSCS